MLQGVVGMMMKKSQVKFDKTKLFNELLNKLSVEQTSRLINYATQKIVQIGERIKSYHSRNNMDRTGNLLNSLCWYVSYDGEMQGSGFYREEVYPNPHPIVGGSSSYLHEYVSQEMWVEFNGRGLAKEYLAKHASGGVKGWRVVFAILAPYWGYWEQGFRMKSHFGGGQQFLKFAVMSEFFDDLRMELKPARVTFTISVPKYSYKSNKYRGRNKRIGYRKMMSQKQYNASLGKRKRR